MARRKSNFIVDSANEAANFVYLPIMGFLLLGVYLFLVPYLEELRLAFLYVWDGYLIPAHAWGVETVDWLKKLFGFDQ